MLNTTHQLPQTNNEEFYRHLIESSPDGIAIYTAREIVFINATGARILGAASVEQILGKPIITIAHPDYNFFSEQQIQQKTNDISAIPFAERKFIRLDGANVEVEAAEIPITYYGEPAVQLVFRDITERKQAEAKLAEHNRQLTILQSTGAAIASSLDVRYILETVTQDMTTLLEVEGCAISKWDKETDTVVLIAQYGPAGWWDPETLGKTHSLVDFPLTKWVLEEQIPQQMTISQSNIDPAELAYMQEIEITTLMMLPMVYQNRVVGLVEIEDSRVERSFTYQEISMAKLMASQAAGAIENARLFEQTQVALEETAVLYRVAHTLTQMDNEQAMFEFIVAEYLQHLGLQQGGVLIFDDDKAYGSLKAHMVDGKLVESEFDIPVIGNPAYDQLIENKESVIIKDTINDKLLGSARELTLGLGIKSLLLVPIMARGEVSGCLEAGSTESIHEFSDREIALVEAVANQLGIALENMRLYAERERRAEQLAVLHQIDRAISISLRLDDIYYAFAQHANRLLPYDRMAIILLDGDEVRLTYAIDHNQDGSPLPVGTTLPRQSSAIGRMASMSQPLLRHSHPATALFAEDGLLFTDDIQTSMITPLRIKGRTIGTWNIGSRQVGAYSPDDLGIAQTIADQLATAIENAQLYKQARQEIAERKQAEVALEEERALLAQRVRERTAELSKANAELLRASRLKDEFLTNMSHELRTPLNAILGSAEILQTEVFGPLNEKQLKYSRNIDESGNHLLSLINDILDLSKIEAGKMDLEIQPVSIKSVCQSSLRLVKELAHKKQLRVSSTIDDTITTLKADERRLKQILVNLLGNAIKFTPEGGEIGLDVVGDATQQAVRFTVWDTGIGISQEDMSQLFQPFVQIDSDLSRQYKGTGLGLSLVARMTELHRGGISVESEVGQGSRFTISLPYLEPDGVAQPVEETKLHKVHGSQEVAIPNQRGKPPLILLAEDNEDTIKMLLDILEVRGYQTLIARNGREVIELTREENPDVILMDIQMPIIDGLEATRRLRADRVLPTVPIIALTALAMAGDRERCLEAGMNEYMSKPVSPKQLIKTIETFLTSN